MDRTEGGAAEGTQSGGREVRFGAFALDLDEPELRRHGAPVAIRATPLRLLVALARRVGRVVPKQQLIEEVWPGVVVTDASLATALRELRRALGDDGRRQELVQTLRHRGIRLLRPAAPQAAAGPSIHEGVATAADADAARHHALLSRLGAALFESGRRDEARAAYREAAHIARGEGDAASFVRAALDFTGDLAHTETAVYSEERVALLEAAIAHEAAVPAPMRARLRALLAFNLAWRRREEALALAAGAAERARAAGDPDALARVLYHVTWTCWSPDNLAERQALAREMLAAAEAANDAFLAGFAHALDAATRLEAGDRAGAEAAAEHADAGVRTRAQAGMSIWREGWRASMALLDGRFREAEHHAEASFRRSRSLAGLNAARIRVLQIAWLRFDQGRLDELGPAVEALDATLPVSRAGRALIDEAAGRRDAARRGFEALTEALGELPRDPFWMGTLTVLAELALRLRDARRADTLYEAMAPHEGQCVLFGARSACRGSAALYLGLLARLAGRGAAVVPHLETAVRVNTRLRAVPLLARAELELARALADRGTEEDLPRARTLLATAADLYRGLGLRHSEVEVEALRERLDTRKQP